MTDQNMVLLTAQIDKERKEIKTDSYAMSVGELISMYKEGELELTPNYQRLFRWDANHRTNFIESILIGIPLPPIFVAQKKGAKWSIVDGLQRVSTILNLCGELKVTDSSGNIVPFVFTEPEKLTKLEGMTWDALDDDTKRIIKRTKFDIKIILVEDNIYAQYELFKRLNTGAVHLEAQEIRNCLLIMLNENYYTKINELKGLVEFKRCIKLSEKKYEIEHHMELILRYFIIRNNVIEFENYKSNTLLSDFFDSELSALVKNPNFNINSEEMLFRRVFNYLDKILGGNVFRKFNVSDAKFETAFSSALFDVIMLGISSNIDKFEERNQDDVISFIKAISEDADFVKNSDRGIKAIIRIKNMIEFSKKYFA